MKADKTAEVMIIHRCAMPSTSSCPMESFPMAILRALLLLAEFNTDRMLFLLGSNGSTTTSSVPLISARQNGQP